MRITSSMRIATVPRVPTTWRIRTGGPSRWGMQSTTVTAPPSVSNSVSSTRVPSRYRRRMERAPSRGARLNRPCSGPPSRAAKQAGESKRGRQSQSMEPRRETRAAVSPSPISA